MPAPTRAIKARQNKLVKTLQEARDREYRLWHDKLDESDIYRQGRLEGLEIAIRIVEMLGD